MWKSLWQTKLKNLYVINFKPTWKSAEIFAINMNSDYATAQHIWSPLSCTQPLKHSVAHYQPNKISLPIFLSSSISLQLDLFSCHRTQVQCWAYLMSGSHPLGNLYYSMTRPSAMCNATTPDSQPVASSSWSRENKKSPKKPAQMDLGHRKTHENWNNLIAVK